MTGIIKDMISGAGVWHLILVDADSGEKYVGCLTVKKSDGSSKLLLGDLIVKDGDTIRVWRNGERTAIQIETA